MPEIKPEQLYLIVGFILPGAISMFIYGLKIPQKDFALKDRIIEAICFSLLNFVVVWIPISAALGTEFVKSKFAIEWFVLIVGFVIAPLVWPFLLVWLLRKCEAHGWIGVRAKTAWDDFFNRQQLGCWIQIVLKDDKVIGGRFGKNSYASAYPDSGHLLLEEVWNVDEDGYFSEPLPGKPGIILRPEDYKFIRVYNNGGEAASTP